MTDPGRPPQRDPEKSSDLVDFCTGMVHQMPYPACILDFRGTAVIVNRAFLDLFSIPSGEMFIGRYNILEDPLLKENDLLDEVKRALQGQTVFIPEMTISREAYIGDSPQERSGEFTAEVTIFPVQLTPGEAPHGVFILKDITADKSTLEELSRSERRYRELTDFLPQPVFETDLNGQLTFANKTALEMFGYTEDDFQKGKNYLQMLAPEDREAAEENARRALGGQVSGGNEYRAMRKDGSTFPALIYSAPFYREGELIGLRGVLLDITRQKLAEEERRLSEERYETIIENTGTGMVILEEDMSISFVNSRMEKLTGFSSEELVGKPFPLESVAEGDRERIVAYHTMRRADPSSVPASHEFTMTSRDGEEIRLMANVAIIPGTTRSVASLIDISDVARAQAAVRESEETLRAIVENTGTAMVILEEDLTISFANAEFLETTGYSNEELVGKKAPIEELAPKDAERVRQYHTLRTEDPQAAPRNYEVTIRSRSGMEKQMLVTVTMMPGRPARLFSLLDITSRAEAEKSLRESEEQFRSLAEQSPNMIFINQEGRIVYANRECSAALGYGVEEYLSLEFDYLTLIAPESLELVKEKYRQHQEGREVDPYEYGLVTRDGERLQAINSTKLIQYRGRPAILIVVTDITDRKRTEDLLRLSEARFRTAIDSLPFDFFVIGSGGRYVMQNSTCRENWGDVVGKWPEDVAPDRATAELWRENNLLALAGKTTKDEVTVTHPDGSKGYYYNIISPVRSGDKISGVLGLNIDISQRRLAEEELKKAYRELERQNEELRKLDQMKDALIRDVSHELKTPVAKHAMQMEMLRWMLSEKGLIEEVSEIFEVMEAAVRRQESVIRNILTLSRLEAGARQYRREQVRLDEVIKAVVADYQHTLESYSIEVGMDISEESVTSDGEMLWHVFSNLVNNAIKYRGRQLPRRIEVCFEKKGGEIHIKMSDNGIGLLEEERNKAFDRFYQSSPSAEGIGVGLTISRMIVEGLGGRIWLDSRGAGEGTTAMVALPMEEAG